MAGIHSNESESAQLIECYNTASEENLDCRAANIGICSNDDALQCGSTASFAVDACSGSLSYEVLEPLFNCTFS